MNIGPKPKPDNTINTQNFIFFITGDAMIRFLSSVNANNSIPVAADPGLIQSD